MTWEQKCRLIALHPTACARYFHNRVQKFFKYVLNSPHSPFGHLDDLFYWIEFQHRGRPHVHGIAWIRDAPKFDMNSDEEVCAYIDRIIACTSNVLVMCLKQNKNTPNFKSTITQKHVTRKLKARKFADLECHGHQ